MLKKDWVFRRGDIYMANLTPVCGSEQGGVRPVLIIQNNVGNYHSPTLVVATFTSKARKKTKQPTHYLMKHNPALKKPSVVLLEQIRTVDKQRIERYLGKASRKEMSAVNKALLISLALDKSYRQ
ncbi:MAG: type II toxin-antitoxin system PemK/MazF family toxin [Enterocloster clostridioformis]|jgi:mRNA interferase MazF|uniref:type II toxin-antitoxin system PemK/MazF family toxin n=1 Tax=Enterocloster clostridioformis TaxID=1531 RepID=UPI001DD81FB4|nr:type II toxin-antitoxin system PemK/MazF family toxin [Enterocloster clostridioformis]MBS7002154.1 type II toxin-antitoxin system PemK/MazF family toxin [Enterocloster clostridioformis]